MTSHRPLIYCLTTVLITLLLFSATAFAAPILKLHSHGHDVSLLQKELKRLNYMVSSPDGNFDESTKKAVLEFQRDQKAVVRAITDSASGRADLSYGTSACFISAAFHPVADIGGVIGMSGFSRT